MDEFQQIWDSCPLNSTSWTSLSETLRAQIVYFGKKVEFRTRAMFLSAKKSSEIRNEGLDKDLI